IADVRTRLAQAPAGPDLRSPLAMISRRRVESMNSWTNDLPGIHRRLSSNRLEINPADARTAGVRDDDWVEVASPVARVIVQAVVSTAIRPGAVVCEHGWGSRVFDPCQRARQWSMAPTETFSSTTTCSTRCPKCRR